MPLVSRLIAYPETIIEMEKAAVARFAEGESLLAAGLYDGSIYLFGYTAEMLLKTAGCRVHPAVTRNYTVASYLTPARRSWQAVFGGALPSGHDLLFLSLTLEDARIVHGKGRLPVATARLFNACVNRIYSNWFAEMRYHRRAATDAEAFDTRADVAWLRANYRALWS